MNSNRWTGAVLRAAACALLVAAGPAQETEGPVEVGKVLDAYRRHLPSAENLEWYTLDWVNTLGEARKRAAQENRPILFIQTNKEGDLFCSLC